MGGHGGLNILPQKRWHLYRRDNRERVARDERHAREAREAGRNSAIEQNLEQRITTLRRGRDAPSDATPAATTETTENVKASVDAHPLAASSNDNHGSRRGDDHSPPPPSNDNHRDQHGSPQRRKPSGNQHFNLFDVEERENAKTVAAHKKYLEEIGHDPKNDESAFATCKSLSTPWYLKQLPSSTRYEEHSKKGHSPGSPGELAQLASSSFTGSASSQQSKRELKKERKRDRSQEHEKRHKYKRRKKRKSSSSTSDSDSGREMKTWEPSRDSRDSGRSKIEELRQQRLDREASERKKTFAIYQRLM